MSNLRVICELTVAPKTLSSGAVLLRDDCYKKAQLQVTLITGLLVILIYQRR